MSEDLATTVRCDRVVTEATAWWVDHGMDLQLLSCVHGNPLNALWCVKCEKQIADGSS